MQLHGRESAVGIVRCGPVGWVVIGNVEESVEKGFDDPDFIYIHTALDLAFNELRHDAAIRVIGVTGAEDGEFYSMARRSKYDEDPRWRARFDATKKVGGGHGVRGGAEPKAPLPNVPHTIETLMVMEKPVVARVNGDAIGFGQTVLLNCDMTVAVEWAVISDVHMGQGDVIDHNGERRGMPYAVSPGDGAMTVWPLSLPPQKAKEYQLLSRAWTAREMAAMNIINYAVPDFAALDAKVDELINALLARPQFALVRTKKLHQKAIIQQWNLAMDLSAAYEGMDFADHTRVGNISAPGWTPEVVTAPPGGWAPKTAPSAPAKATAVETA
jgi:enoyl-CoA hydratase